MRFADYEETQSQRTASADRPSKAPVATGAALAGHCFTVGETAVIVKQQEDV